MKARHALDRALSPLRTLNGLRLRWQVLIGVAAYLLALAVLVVTTINGSSSGAFYRDFYGGQDPRLLLGGPRGLRSDEWMVTTPLLIGQIEQGMPRFSRVIPGGLDVSVLFDVPYRDVWAVFRPQNLGFGVLPLDNAFALRWWLPLVALGIAVHTLVVVVWRKPLAALAVSVAFAFSPFTQWWFGAGTFWPLTFAVMVCLSVVVAVRVARPWVHWVTAGLTAYVAVVAAMTMYPPFLVPAALVAAAFVLGTLVDARHLAWRTRLLRLVPLLVGGAVAGVLLVLFLTSHAATLDDITSTEYPGDRRWPAGDSTQFPWAPMFAGVFGIGLRASTPEGFAINASEGSSFLLTGLYLLPVALVLLRPRRRPGRVDGTLAALLAVLVVLVAFVYVPGWDAVASLLLLDLTSLPRLIVGFGLVALLLLVVVVDRVSQEGPPARWVAAVSVALVLGAHALVALHLSADAPQILAEFWAWPVLVLAFAAAIWFYARGRATLPSVVVAVVALAMVAGVVPLYRGVLDLRETQFGQLVEEVQTEDPGTWVGLDDGAVVAVLRESGVPSFSGVQGWPSDEMWDLIDPTGQHESAWNRYAYVGWTADPAAAPIALPAADALTLRFDSCEAFAQQHVDYVATSEPLDQDCVQEIASTTTPDATYRVYEVVSSAS
ncbi:DUF7657 domain-containing protein [Cellulomonas xylanilytica]|uniref:Glycosyltransferase RgtA/B/C/D-like domain-containing protein n=1 Tax=Cellulomonas xylanilytica TaxID=233583 RepID=A0A510V441_9CELL|nr:hypothetical protein [Cellulomonas xylanilytica]GEK21647.1 hypothetical protein CXY01_21670 [Cellulomonas xylanilytica]